jgi:hypothetical protein
LAQALAQLQQASTHEELRQLPLRYHQLFQGISSAPARLEVAAAAAARFEELNARLGEGPDDAFAAFLLARLCAIHIRYATDAPSAPLVDGTVRRLGNTVNAFFSSYSDVATLQQVKSAAELAIAAVSLTADVGQHRDVRMQLAGWMLKGRELSGHAIDSGVRSTMQRLSDTAQQGLRTAAGRPSTVPR